MRTAPSLPIANSSGQTIVLPLPQTTKPIGVARLFNNVGGPNAVEGLFTTSPASHVGYGLVVEFQ